MWYKHSGDRIYNNIWLTATRAIGMRAAGKWGIEVDRNLFVRDADWKRTLSFLVDMNSIVGDPMFVDPAAGDFRVKPDSPALRLGFKNFPMDKFGVMKPELRATAKTPKLPVPNIPDDMKGVTPPEPETAVVWLGANASAITGEAYSAFGVAKEEGGIHLEEVPPDSDAARVGLQTGDLIQTINGHSVNTPAELLIATAVANKTLTVGFVRNQ